MSNNQTTLRAIRDFCRLCEDGASGVRICGSMSSCPLWVHRFGKLKKSLRQPGGQYPTPLEAVHQYCLSCVCYPSGKVEDCGGEKVLFPIPHECELFRFRFGTTNPEIAQRRKARRKSVLSVKDSLDSTKSK